MWPSSSSWLCSHWVRVSPSPHTGTFAPEGGCAEASWAQVHIAITMAAYVAICGSSQMQPRLGFFFLVVAPQIQCRAEVWSEWGWSIGLAGPRCMVRWMWGMCQPVGQISLCPASGASQDTCSLHKWSPGFSSLSVCPSSQSSNQQRHLVFSTQ